MTEWALFSWNLIRNCGPPISQNTTGDLAPPRHLGTVNDYNNNFIAYVLHVDIPSELHQVHLFVTGLRDSLRMVVEHHHPRKMETDISLARKLEHLPPTATNVERNTSDIDTGTDLIQRGEAVTPDNGMDQERVCLPPTAPPAPQDTPAAALQPTI